MSQDQVEPQEVAQVEESNVDAARAVASQWVATQIPGTRASTDIDAQQGGDGTWYFAVVTGDVGEESIVDEAGMIAVNLTVPLVEWAEVENKIDLPDVGLEGKQALEDE